ncbi:Meiotic recombination protein SPO11, partial [Araneus ventricosus]
MAFEIQARYGADETFWTNIDKLHRILLCFSKETVTSEVNLQSQAMKDQSKAVDLSLLNQRNCDSQCLNNKEFLLKKIENIFQNYLIKNGSDNFGSIQIPNRQLWKNTSFEIKKGIKMIANPTLKTVGTQRKGSERKLVRFLHVLTKIHKLIKTNSYRTKRELFYEDVNLFKTQKALDDILDDIACLLKTPKIKLHVLTTSKGCISGNLRYKESDGSYIDCSESNQGVLISNDVDSISYIQSDARFILVVEKSAVFQMLLDCNITKLLHPCIMITQLIIILLLFEHHIGTTSLHKIIQIPLDIG